MALRLTDTPNGRGPRPIRYGTDDDLHLLEERAPPGTTAAPVALLQQESPNQVVEAAGTEQKPAA